MAQRLLGGSAGGKQVTELKKTVCICEGEGQGFDLKVGGGGRGSCL